MMFLLFKVVISVLFAFSFFHKMWKRSVSTFLMLVTLFAWAIADNWFKDSAFVIAAFGIIFIYVRAMIKGDDDKFFEGKS